MNQNKQKVLEILQNFKNKIENLILNYPDKFKQKKDYLSKVMQELDQFVQEDSFKIMQELYRGILEINLHITLIQNILDLNTDPKVLLHALSILANSFYSITKQGIDQINSQCSFDFQQQLINLLHHTNKEVVKNTIIAIQNLYPESEFLQKIIYGNIQNQGDKILQSLLQLHVRYENDQKILQQSLYLFCSILRYALNNNQQSQLLQYETYFQPNVQFLANLVQSENIQIAYHSLCALNLIFQNYMKVEINFKIQQQIIRDYFAFNIIKNLQRYWLNIFNSDTYQIDSIPYIIEGEIMLIILTFTEGKEGDQQCSIILQSKFHILVEKFLDYQTISVRSYALQFIQNVLLSDDEIAIKLLNETNILTTMGKLLQYENNKNKLLILKICKDLFIKKERNTFASMILKIPHIIDLLIQNLQLDSNSNEIILASLNILRFLLEIQSKKIDKYLLSSNIKENNIYDCPQIVQQLQNKFYDQCLILVEIERLGGIPIIEQLQYSANSDIQEIVKNFIDKYFEIDN